MRVTESEEFAPTPTLLFDLPKGFAEFLPRDPRKPILSPP